MAKKKLLVTLMANDLIKKRNSFQIFVQNYKTLYEQQLEALKAKIYWDAN